MPVIIPMRFFISSLLLSCLWADVLLADQGYFKLDSTAVNYPDINLSAEEVERDGRISRMRFTDHKPEQGSLLAKDFFRLRSLSSFAKYRGFRYFLVLQEEGTSSKLVGLLSSKEENLAEVLGKNYASIPKDAIIDIQVVLPLGD